MGKTFTLITAVLMTMAALAWLASAVLVSHTGEGAMMRWGVVMAFTVMSVFYWRLYFKRKSADTSGTK